MGISPGKVRFLGLFHGIEVDDVFFFNGIASGNQSVCHEQMQYLIDFIE